MLKKYKFGYCYHATHIVYYKKRHLSMPENEKGEMNMDTNRYALNKELAQMLKGGVIMDVTTPEQAKIAEAAGACAVMALERIPADIRAVFPA